MSKHFRDGTLAEKIATLIAKDLDLTEQDNRNFDVALEKQCTDFETDMERQKSNFEQYSSAACYAGRFISQACFDAWRARTVSPG